MKRATKVWLVFVTAMLLGWLVLSLSGCHNSTGDIAIFSQVNSCNRKEVKKVPKLPRQMTTRDLINRGRSK